VAAGEGGGGRRGEGKWQLVRLRGDGGARGQVAAGEVERGRDGWTRGRTSGSW
jgi:hypothetical protein